MKKIFLIILFPIIYFACKQKEKPHHTISISKSAPISVEKGSIDFIDSFPSAFVTKRNIAIWKPNGYSSEKKYNVFYMNDGQALFDSTITWNKQEWKIDETISRLMEEGSIEPTIVVGIYNSGQGRHADYFPQKPFESLPKVMQDSFLNKSNIDRDFYLKKPVSDNYLKFLVKELIPYIDQNYNTCKAAQCNYIGGSSMGGLISWYAICEYPEVFSGAACISTHWPGNYPIVDNPIPKQFFHYLNTNLPTDRKFYFDHGTATLDSFYPPLQLVVDSIMISKGYDENTWLTKVFEGEDHSENSWNKRMHYPFTFLLGKQ